MVLDCSLNCKRKRCTKCLELKLPYIFMFEKKYVPDKRFWACASFAGYRDETLTMSADKSEMWE